MLATAEYGIVSCVGKGAMVAGTTSIYSSFATPMRDIDALMLNELSAWPWGNLAAMRRLVAAQIGRPGKRLRPLLGLAVCASLNGRPDVALAPLGAVELYHQASLVLDDVQDNSEVRRGVASVRTSASTSTAINVAALTRSLSYHLIHRSPLATAAEKLRMHRELDEAATRLVMGQSIDIGWHEGWYAADAYPYDQMVGWKTGALFGCAAAMGAIAASADETVIGRAREFGVQLGELYQVVDDFLDAFGSDELLGRPAREDLREGKMSAPVVLLLRSLAAAGRAADAEQVAEQLRARHPDVARDLVDLLESTGVAEQLRAEVVGRAEGLRRAALAIADAESGHLVGLVDLVTARVSLSDRTHSNADVP